MSRSRRALLALALALPASAGAALAVTGVVRIADGRFALGLVLLVVGAGCVGLAFAGLRRVNAGGS